LARPAGGPTEEQGSRAPLSGVAAPTKSWPLAATRWAGQRLEEALHEGTGLRCIREEWLTGVALPTAMTVNVGENVGGRLVRLSWQLAHQLWRSVVPGQSSGSWLLDQRRVRGGHPW
jgi:hypothetical protein